MTAILKEFNPVEIENVKSEKSKEFIKLLMLQEQIEIQLHSNFQTLTDEEKQESFEIVKRVFSIPDTLTVAQAAKIMGISPQRVRGLCSNGDLNAVQTMKGSGKWRIEPKQMMKYPGWAKFIDDRSKLGAQSKKIANFMGENLQKLNTEKNEE